MWSGGLVCSFIGIFIHLLNTPGWSAASRINVALSGTAKQSSTDDDHGGGPAQKAIDGNDDHKHKSYSWSRTKNNEKSWWRVQLSGVYKVAEIEVTAPTKSRMIHAQILIGNSPENNGNNNPRCATYSKDQLTQTFQCRGMEGQFINIYKPCGNGILKLAEVKVYGELVPPPASSNTMVMGKNVTLVMGRRLCWSDALLYCRDFHSDLLSIRSPEEQELIQQLVARASLPLTSHLWVGLRSRTYSNSSWFWMTGDRMSFTQWEQDLFAPPKPRPCGGIASMEPSTWSRRYCDEHLNFICVKGPDEVQAKVRFYSSTRGHNICGY